MLRPSEEMNLVLSSDDSDYVSDIVLDYMELHRWNEESVTILAAFLRCAATNRAFNNYRFVESLVGCGMEKGEAAFIWRLVSSHSST
jgi:hypothetical protein